MQLVVIILCAIALGLAAYSVVRREGADAVAWAVLALAAAILLLVTRG